MKIIKRDGRLEDFKDKKIEQALAKAFKGAGQVVEEVALAQLATKVVKKVGSKSEVMVEEVQDAVEKVLMETGYYDVGKNYILYRFERTKKRMVRLHLSQDLPDPEKAESLLKRIQADFTSEQYSLDLLEGKYLAFIKDGMTPEEKLIVLVKAAVELTTQEAPQWEFIAGRLYNYQFQCSLKTDLVPKKSLKWSQKVHSWVEMGLYGTYIIQNYTDAELNQAFTLIKEERDDLLTYSALELLVKRYLIRNYQNQPLESVQEMFLGIALHLALPEKKKKRLEWVQKFYDMLSTLKVTMATPTLSNARKPFYQLSSCFIDTVPDSLTGIYQSLTNFAQVSKFGGGMGLYFGKVRARGGAIRGFEGAAGGVLRWIKLANDTAVAVDQLGMRHGAVAVYLDVWHKDLPEFLALKTNNGDERLKAHDVFPAICFPNLFWQMTRDNLEGDWHLFCPDEVRRVQGYALEDFYGAEWEEKYWACVANSKLSRRTLAIKDIVRLIIKSAIETGTPFIFNRDLVNEANPNSHQGVIYSSNLCTEIAQNMSPIQEVEQAVQIVDGEEVVVNTTKPGDFVVCNLASLSLGNLDLEKKGELEEIVGSVVRALDNVIDLNFYPLPYAKVTNQKYRPIGLGVSGYHHVLAKNQISWESEAHLEFADKLFERINMAAVEASADLAAEKGKYRVCEGSEWQTGAYFDKRDYVSPQWKKIRTKVAKQGMRNAWLMAIAPTSSTSIIAGTTAGIDPIMNRFFLEEKKNSLTPRVAPELSRKTFWLYKNAHLIDQHWSIRACGIRQRHIDQSQSFNLYITDKFSFKQVLQLYINAFENGVKTIYYVRSKSLEVEECTSCAS